MLNELSFTVLIMKIKILLVCAALALVISGCDWVRSRLDLPTSKDIAAKRALIIQREMQLDSSRSKTVDSSAAMAGSDSSKSIMSEDSAEMSAAKQRAEQQRIEDEAAVKRLEAEQNTAKQKAEQRKIADQKAAEQQKIAAQKAEQQRVAELKRQQQIASQKAIAMEKEKQARLQQQKPQQQKPQQQKPVQPQKPQQPVQQQKPQQMQQPQNEQGEQTPLAYRYYLIVGSYRLSSSVQNKLRQLKNMEADAVAIPLKNGLTMVSAVGFNSLEDAKSAMSDVKDIAPDAWIYSRARGLHK